MTQQTEHYVALYRDDEAIGMVIIKSEEAGTITDVDVINSLSGTPLEANANDLTWKVMEPEEALALAKDKANESAVRGICPICVAEGMVGRDSPSDTVKAILSGVINAGTENMRMQLCDKHIAAAHKEDSAWLVSDAYFQNEAKFMPTKMDLIPVDMMNHVFEHNADVMTIMRKRRVMILPEGEYRKVKSRVWVVTLIEAVKFIAKDMKSEGLDKEAEDMVNAAFESFVPFFRHIEEDTSGDADITNEAPASVQ